MLSYSKWNINYANCDNMKIKYLIMVGLILAVLTIGAVSASDDANNLTADDAQGDSIQEIPEDDGVLKDPADDYEKRIDVPEEIVKKDGWIEEYVLVDLPSDASGNVSAYLDDDDEPFYNKEFQGYYMEIYFNNVPLTFSNHTLKLNYTGDSNYNGFQNIYQLNVTYDLDFSRESSHLWGEDMVIQVSEPTDIEGNLTLLMNGKSYPFVIYELEEYDSRIYSCTVPEYNFGINNFTITLSNDPKYPNKSFKGSADVFSLILIEYPDSELGYPMRYSDEGSITLAMPDDAEGTLNVTVDGVQFADATLSDGKFFVSLADLSVGKHIISVNYTGSDYYVLPIEDYELSVIPYVSVPKFIYTGSEDNYTITVVLDDNASEVLNIVIKNDPYLDLQFEEELYNDFAKGNVTINLPKLNPGIYRVYVKYAGDDVYDGEDNYFKIDARSDNPNFDLNVTFPDKVVMGSDAVILCHNVPMSATYSVLVNGKDYGWWYYYDDQISVEIPTEGMLFGENDVTVIFNDLEGYYNQSSASGKITVELRGIPEEIPCDEPIWVHVGENDGYVVLKIDGRNFDTQLVDGGGVYFDTYDLSGGIHTYEIAFYDKNNVKIASKSGSFNMTYVFYTNIENPQYPLVGDFELKVSVPDDANGTVLVSVDGKNYTAMPYKGAARIVITNLKEGKNNVTVTFGDKKYPQKQIKQVINCVGYGFNVQKDGSALAYISLQLPEDATGNITVYEVKLGTEKIMSVKLENGYARINGTEFGVGVHNIIAKYEGEKYIVENKEISFRNIAKVEVDMAVVAGQNASILVEMNATGNVTVKKLSDESELIATIPIINGKAQGNISLPIGNYHIGLEYQGNDVVGPLGPDGFEYDLDVTPLNVDIPLDLNSDGNGNITLELPEGVTGKVSVYDAVGSYKVALVEDIAYTSDNKTIAISLPRGNHNLILKFTDDKTGETFVKKGEAYVPKPASDESVVIPETLYDDVIDLELPKDATGGVLVTIDDDTTYIPLVNGSTKIDLSELAKGNHTISLKYLGDDNYGGFEKTFNVAVKDPVDPNLSISVANITEGNPAVVTITTDASFTGNVTVRIGNTNYTVSVLNGKGTLNVPGLAVGTYNATAIFAAQTGFIESVRNTTFTVSKKQPVTPDKPVTPAKKADKITLTLKKVKVKRSAKKLVIKATLKINGKAVKGKVIKFKFNKKTYKAKTDKKGVAKITVKKSVLKKLKAGKKVKYQATYGKVTKKYTVKVKK